MGDVEDAFKSVVGGVTDVVSNVASLLTGGLSKKFGDILGPIGGIVTVLTGGLGGLLGGIGGLVGGITGGIAGPLGGLVAGVSGLISGVTTVLLTPLAGVVTGIAGEIQTLVGGISANLTTAIANLKGNITQQLSPILTPIKEALEPILETVKAIKAPIDEMLEPIAEIREVVSDLADLKILSDLITGTGSVTANLGAIADGKGEETAAAIAELVKSIATLGTGMIDKVNTEIELTKATFEGFEKTFKRSLRRETEQLRVGVLAAVTPELGRIGFEQQRVIRSIAKLNRHIEDVPWFAAMFVRMLR